MLKGRRYIPGRAPEETPEPTAIVKARVKGEKLIAPLAREVEGLEITSDEEYDAADVLLGDIRRAQTEWAAEMQPMLTPAELAAKHAKEALAAIKAHGEKVSKPLSTFAETVRLRMADWQRAKLQLQAKADNERRAEAQRIEQELVEARKKEAAAKAPSLRERLQQQRVHLEVQAEAIAETPAPEKTKADHSTVRKVKAWRLKESPKRADVIERGTLKAILMGIGQGKIPGDIIKIDAALVDALFRDDPDVVAQWPGFDVYEDVVIAGKGGR